ncbi:DUF4870 domain-containing protein [Streptomyces sp. NBC_01808]|uniref:DUF4870 domain-containing protein n=1 Tax=Streptomyces sp. NBC_01808 TaxID=2975947 RepID=UPI002DD80D1C|nr:DUF4870 domain-containing protein [Streptomyces sp. NBC_01808]WSA39749.1 DUF4870 domain-containing protein [Streptomyces sp. NBC_01808]
MTEQDPSDDRAAGQPPGHPAGHPAGQQPPPLPPYAPPGAPTPYAPQGAPALHPHPGPAVPYPPQLYPHGPPGKPPPDSAMWAHLSALLIFIAGTGACCIGFLIAWIGPLNIRGKTADPFIRHHGTEGLNWGITQIVAVAVFGALTGGSIYMAEEQGWPEWVPAVPLTAWGVHLATSFAFAIVGCRRAKNGVLWSYPRPVALPFTKP